MTACGFGGTSIQMLIDWRQRAEAWKNFFLRGGGPFTSSISPQFGGHLQHRRFYGSPCDAACAEWAQHLRIRRSADVERCTQIDPPLHVKVKQGPQGSSRLGNKVNDPKFGFNLWRSRVESGPMSTFLAAAPVYPSGEENPGVACPLGRSWATDPSVFRAPESVPGH